MAKNYETYNKKEVNPIFYVKKRYKFFFDSITKIQNIYNYSELASHTAACNKV